MAKRLYKARLGTIYTQEVVKETPCYYITERGEDTESPFFYLKRWDKKTACTLPSEAIMEELNSAKAQVGMLSDRLDKAKARLMAAEDLFERTIK